LLGVIRLGLCWARSSACQAGATRTLAGTVAHRCWRDRATDGGLLLVAISGFTALSVTSGAGIELVAGAAVAMIAVHVLLPPQSSVARRRRRSSSVSPGLAFSACNRRLEQVDPDARLDRRGLTEIRRDRGARLLLHGRNASRLGTQRDSLISSVRKKATTRIGTA